MTTNPAPKVELAYEGLDDNGEKITPETMNTRTALRLAGSVLEVVDVAASHNGAALSLRGLRLRTGSCIFEADSQRDESATAQAVRQAGRWIIGADEPPAGSAAARATKAARATMKELTPDESLSLAAGTVRLILAAKPAADVPTIREWTTLRATVLSVGGKGRRVRLIDELEPAAFSLSLDDDDTARDLGSDLYRPVDIEAEIERELDGQGRILRGRVMRVTRLDFNIDPIKALRDWFEPMRAYWESVDDVEAELAAGRL